MILHLLLFLLLVLNINPFFTSCPEDVEEQEFTSTWGRSWRGGAIPWQESSLTVARVGRQDAGGRKEQG